MISENPFVNPLMEVSQGNTSVTNANDGTIVVDRWIYNKIGSFQHTVSRDSDAPTLSQSGKIIPYSYRVNLTTPQNNIGSTDECVIVQKIEGYRFRNFAQRPFDMLFSVKADLVGTYCISLRNNVPDLSCIGEFTINQANTWEEKRITFPASPSGGTWNYTDDVGIRIGVVLMAGSQFQTTGGTWNNGYFHKTANQINGVQSGAVNFRITDFDIVDVGSSRHPDRQYSAEYELCRRYRRKFTGLAAGYKFLSGIVDSTTQATFDIPCEGMAKISGINILGMGIYDANTVGNITSITTWSSSSNIVSVSFGCNGGLTVANPSKIRSGSASDYIEIVAIQ